MSTDNQATKLLKELLSIVTYRDNHVDVYSVNTEKITEILDLKIYHPIVDWNCIFVTIVQRLEKVLEAQKLNLDIDKLAHEIHAILVTYPREYIFLLPIPKIFDKKRYPITKKLSIESFTKRQALKFSPSGKSYPKGLDGISARLKDDYYGSPHISTGDTFLQIETRGCVMSIGNYSIFESDPIYTYKTFVSLLIVYGQLIANHQFEVTKSFVQQGYYIYDDEHKFIRAESDIDQTYSYASTLAFKSGHTLESMLKTYTNLIKSSNIPLIDKLRVQILNSLFWFFESQKTTNQNLGTIFYVSAFDSFFNQNEKRDSKIGKISNNVSNTVQNEEHFRELLEQLYISRNEIIHGERAINDYLYDTQKTRETESFRNELPIKICYVNFISKQIDRLEKSLKFAKAAR